jgi:hypothetical protein
MHSIKTGPPFVGETLDTSIPAEPKRVVYSIYLYIEDIWTLGKISESIIIAIFLKCPSDLNP